MEPTVKVIDYSPIKIIKEDKQTWNYPNQALKCYNRVLYQYVFSIVICEKPVE